MRIFKIDFEITVFIIYCASNCKLILMFIRNCITTFLFKLLVGLIAVVDTVVIVEDLHDCTTYSEMTKIEELEKIFERVFNLTDEFYQSEVKDLEIDLPFVVAVGDQSSGKSSVLSSLAQVQLPVGAGTVSKFPLKIVSRKSNEPHYSLSSKVSNKESVKLEDLNDVTTEIGNLAEQLAPENGFSFDEVTLNLQDPRARNVTFVDLPGIIHAPAKNQPKHTVKEVKDMTLSYIEQENAIVLCVVDLTKDLQLNAIFHLFEGIDEEGERTVVVFTKIDQVKKEKLKVIMDEVENKQNFHVYKHFFFVNSAIEIENKYFKDEIYKENIIPKENCTVKKLYFKVCDIMIKQVFASFSVNWKVVKNFEVQTSVDLQLLSSELGNWDKSDILGLIIDAIRDFLGGKFNTDVEKDDVFSEYRQCYREFRKEFQDAMKSKMCEEKLSSQLVEKLRWDEPLNFHNWDSFKGYFWKILECYKAPAQKCQAKIRMINEHSISKIIESMLPGQHKHKEFLMNEILIIFNKMGAELDEDLRKMHEKEKLMFVDDELFASTLETLKSATRKEVKTVDNKIETFAGDVLEGAGEIAKAVIKESHPLAKVGVEIAETLGSKSDQPEEEKPEKFALKTYEQTTAALQKITLDRLCTAVPSTIRYYLNECVRVKIQQIVKKDSEFQKLPWELSEKERRREELRRQKKMIEHWEEELENLRKDYERALRPISASSNDH